MARKVKTIRHYVHTDNFKKVFREVERELIGSGYKRFYGDRVPNHSDVYDIYCWRWHGEWSGGHREFFCRFYKPAA